MSRPPTGRTKFPSCSPILHIYGSYSLTFHLRKLFILSPSFWQKRFEKFVCHLKKVKACGVSKNNRWAFQL